MTAPRARRPRLALYRHVILNVSETFIKNQAESFDEFDVELFGITRTPALEPEVATYVLAESGALAAARVPVFQLTRRSGALRKAMADFGADVVAAHFAQDGWRVLATAQRLGIPLVVMCHGSDVLISDEAASAAGGSTRQLAGHWADLADGAALFVASSQFLADALIARGVPADKIVVRYLGIPVPPVQPEGERSGVLSLGRLIPSKGGLGLLDAHALLVKDHPGTRLTFAGDGPERARLVARARELGIDDLVTFEGVVTTHRVSELLSSASVLVAPSIPVEDGTSEGLGLTPVEAGAHRLPVVAYATGGLPEAVGAEGEGGGLLVPAGDVAGLADAIGRVLDDKALATRLGELGRARVERMFEVGACVRALEETLLDVVRKAKR